MQIIRKGCECISLFDFPKSLGVDYVKAKPQEHESCPGFLFRGVAGNSEKYTTSPSEAMSSFNALRGL